MLRVDKANANGINKRYIKLLKEAKLDCIFNDNIAEPNINQYGLHINESGVMYDVLYGSQLKKKLGVHIF